MGRPGSENKRSQNDSAALRRRIRRLKAVVDAGALTNTTLDLPLIADRIVSMATSLIGAERGSLFLVDREAGTLTSLVAQGVGGEALALRVGEGIVGTVAATGKPIVLKDPYADPRFDRSFDEATGYRTRSLLTVPVRDREDGLVAVLQLLNHRRNGFAREDVTFLAELGVPFAIALATARLHRAIVEQERLRQEMRLAAEIQQTLRPSDLDAVPGLEVRVSSEPCLEVGGDYYDLIPGADGTWWIVVADISGKGVSAALIASNLQAYLWSRRNIPVSLESLMADGNDLLHRLTQGKKYATLVLAHWDPSNATLKWINAGHPPMVLASGKLRTRLEAGGPPLGLIPGLPYTAGSARLKEGDLLLMVTDGITEAGGEGGGEEFGMEGVLGALDGAASPDDVLERLQGGLARHLRGASPKDDVTLLCLRRQLPEGGGLRMAMEDEARV
jgi:sigma-B regulation protein RsbU (phosphoserine phosphatase)